MTNGCAGSGHVHFRYSVYCVSLGALRFRHLPKNEHLVVYHFVFGLGGDIAAYYVGKNFGRHKLAPVVSPNKSWEGAIASVIASIMGIALLVFHWRETLNAILYS